MSGYRASTLDRLNDLRTVVTSKSEAGSGRVYFHRATECLLCRRSH